MAERLFYDSPYKFTDPIRFFKANDPVHYLVDNIPLKQLDENIKFLKDQTEGLLGSLSSSFLSLEIDRTKFSELKPYVDGTNNVIKVKPGKFTARVNDAYSLNLLQAITQSDGLGFPSPNDWTVKTVSSNFIQNVLAKFRDSVFYGGMNGLAERAFAYAMNTTDLPHQFIAANNPLAVPSGNDLRPAYPGVLGSLWIERSDTDDWQVYGATGNSLNTFRYNWVAEAEFVRRWRGVARTALVNVENELEIEIPPFDASDFYYIDENGVSQAIQANHRIDLVFIYTKPVDTSAVAINKFSGGSPVTITQPILGIVKGAGVGVSFKTSNTTTPTVSIIDEDGNQKILANPGDENGGNTGFGSIRGSFPSPDDLMNLTPLLSNNLETTNMALVGQSILPVAYVVVRRATGTNENGINIIYEDDLIDIRPFFRTAELSYNERAGIAAAVPQISLANPVASMGYVDHLVNLTNKDYISRISEALTQVNTAPTNSRIVGSGYIKGGMSFGVEGSLAKMLELKYGITDREVQRSQILSRFGFPIGQTMPDFPDWDMAKWLVNGSYANKGTYPNDYINFHSKGNTTLIGSRTGVFKTNAQTTRITNLGTDPTVNQSSEQSQVSIYFVKKTIHLDKSSLTWMGDYHVDVQLLNCMPLSCRVSDGETITAAGGASIWVDKRSDQFTIFVSWVARDHINQTVPVPGPISNRYPHQNRNDGHIYAGFSVINQEFIDWDFPNQVVNGEIDAGVAIYPTVAFRVYGIPTGASYLRTNLNASNPILPLA